VENRFRERSAIVQLGFDACGEEKLKRLGKGVPELLAKVAMHNQGRSRAELEEKGIEEELRLKNTEAMGVEDLFADGRKGENHADKSERSKRGAPVVIQGGINPLIQQRLGEERGAGVLTFKKGGLREKDLFVKKFARKESCVQADAGEGGEKRKGRREVLKVTVL